MPERDASGKFLPGHSIQPSDEQRPKTLRVYMRAVNDMLRERVPPELVADRFEEAWQMITDLAAKDSKDSFHAAKYAIDWLQLFTERTAGKPQQSVDLGADTTAAIWMQIAAQGEDMRTWMLRARDLEDDAIDVDEVRVIEDEK